MPWNKKRSINERLIIITATSLVLTLTLLGYYWSQYREADMLYEQIAQIALKPDVTKGNNDNSENKPVSAINHAPLLIRNRDYIGWIKVDGTDISYPIVQSKEELFYLRRNFDKKHSIPGTIFMDYHNNKTFSDTNTMIFGHHMNTGAMFAPLKKFLNKDFFDTNKYVKIFTPEGDFRYEIFAVYETRALYVPYMPGVLTEHELSKFILQIDQLALFNRKMSFSTQDKLITLSTCGYDLNNARIIVHAKRVLN